MANGLVKELQEVEPAVLPERDVRAGKPVLSGVLRYDLLRAITRIVTLASLDLIGLFLAIYTALVVKTAIVNPDQLGQMWAQTKDYFPLGGLVMLLLFGRSGLYRARAQRPGFSKVIASLFQVTLVLLIYAEIEGEPFQSYYIFYGSLFFALLYVSSLRLAVRARLGGRCCARPGTAAARCWWARARTSRPSRTRSATVARSSPTDSWRGHRGAYATACATSARSSSSSATSMRSTRS